MNVWTFSWQAVAALLIAIAAWGPALAQNACTVNCGDKCTRKDPLFGTQYRDPLCYNACLGEKALCPYTGGATLPDPGKVVENLLLNACGLPHAVTLHYISSVCSFAALDPLESQKIELAKQELIAAGLVRAEEFNDVSVSFCSEIHGNGVVPDRDRVFLHSSTKTASPRYLAGLLAHEMEHVRQYRRTGTDKFKCDYTGQVGSCLVNNAARGVANLQRDGYCQTASQNSFERAAYAAGDAAHARLASAPPLPATVESHTDRPHAAGKKSMDSTGGPGITMYCRVRIGKNYCKAIAASEGESCQCNRKLPPGTTGLTRAGGRTMLEVPEGTSWD